ncbi:MAG: ATP phosphoribosyltransferase regulatory subunit [Methylobacteriaceae bacterium]|nr:ATP phosphoribosyltransferase regulatory subunit [Methylobacteriaceae bacterium]
MSAPAPPSYDALLALFERRGYVRVDTPVCQPVGLFLELSGEDIRRRLFLTQDQDGQELCLRPEYTIPVCRQHLESGRDAAAYSYLGPIFRHRPGESGEFLQAGIESIGREDRDAADAEALDLAAEAARLLAGRALAVRIGDMGLFEAVAEALQVPRHVQRRLTLALAAGRSIEGELDPEDRAVPSGYAGLLAALEGQDPGAARAFVEDVISIAGIATVGGRSAADIADRFLSRAARRSGPVSADARLWLRRYLAIAGEPERAIAEVDALAREAGIDLGPTLGRFARRLDLVAPDTRRGALSFAAAFARNLDYYTGFVFELRDEQRPDGRHVAAGGRYDQLFEQLGAERALPAVGFALWLDRLGGGAS